MSPRRIYLLAHLETSLIHYPTQIHDICQTLNPINQVVVTLHSATYLCTQLVQKCTSHEHKVQLIWFFFPRKDILLGGSMRPNLRPNTSKIELGVSTTIRFYPNLQHPVSKLRRPNQSVKLILMTCTSVSLFIQPFLDFGYSGKGEIWLTCIPGARRNTKYGITRHVYNMRENRLQNRKGVARMARKRYKYVLWRRIKGGRGEKQPVRIPTTRRSGYVETREEVVEYAKTLKTYP